MIGRFSLLRQTNRWARYADVAVAVVPAAVPAVVVDADASGRPGYPAEAAAGARHALGRLPTASGDYLVTVTDIRVSSVDTSVGDVHEATAKAVWRALGLDAPPAYRGFGEPAMVTEWLRSRIGYLVAAVTEARHWYEGERDRDEASLVNAWLHFEYGPPTMLHGCGDDLLLSTADPYPSYDMQTAGEIRVGPASEPDQLAGLVGRRLTNAALIVTGEPEPTCAGMVLRTESADLVVGTCCDEWILATDRGPGRFPAHWRRQPWLG